MSESHAISQPVLAGFVGSVSGFASSLPVIVAGLSAVGATQAQTTSALLMLCLTQGVLAMVLSRRYLLPLSFAWSTPGAALLITAGGAVEDFAVAVGTFLSCGLLILLTGLWPALGRLVARLPAVIASAMLAGILFPICLAPVTAAVELPVLVLPVVIVWLVLQRLAPRWAVLAAMGVAAMGIALTAQWEGSPEGPWLPRPEFVAPVLDPAVIVAVGLPLYVVTMAGQNLPGLAVLTAFGYTRPLASPVLIGSGAATALSALFGGHVVNLAALSAAIMAGPEAHPDPGRRWIAAFTGGVTYLGLGVGAVGATAVVAASPPALIQTVAGLALLPAMVAALAGALEDPLRRTVGAVTFLVVASGIMIAGIGSAFWGLVAGGITLVVLHAACRFRPQKRGSEQLNAEGKRSG